MGVFMSHEQPSSSDAGATTPSLAFGAGSPASGTPAGVVPALSMGVTGGVVGVVGVAGGVAGIMGIAGGIMGISGIIGVTG